MDNNTMRKFEDALQELNSILENHSIKKQWLRTDEVVEYLSISMSQVHVLKNEDTLPFTKLNGTLFFRKSDIDELLESNMNS